MAGNCAKYNIQMFDHSENEVLNIFTPLDCSNCCTWLQEVAVTSPLVGKVGAVNLKRGCFSTKFLIKNDTGEAMLHIDTPRALCCGSNDFKVGDETTILLYVFDFISIYLIADYHTERRRNWQNLPESVSDKKLHAYRIPIGAGSSYQSGADGSNTFDFRSFKELYVA